MSKEEMNNPVVAEAGAFGNDSKSDLEVIKNDSKSSDSEVVKNDSQSSILGVIKKDSESYDSEIKTNDSNSSAPGIIKKDSQSSDSGVIKNDSEKSNPELIKKEITNWTGIQDIVEENNLDKSEPLKTENGKNVKNEKLVDENSHEEMDQKGSTPEKSSEKTPESMETVPEPVPETTTKSESSPGKNPPENVQTLLPKSEESPEDPSKSRGTEQASDPEDKETIHLIEETIVIPEVQEPEKTEETIEYNVIEYAEPSLTPPDSSPTLDRQNGPSSPPEPKSEGPEVKKRSVIEVIYDDWSDGNVEEEEIASKVEDPVEDQLKCLLDEKSSRSPKTRTSSSKAQSVTPPEASESPEGSVKREETKESPHEPSSDSKDLLAILEGDVDPEWTNLKPPTLTVEPKSENQTSEVKEIETNSPPKLDPLVERQLALKQLLELPMTSKKSRISPRKSPVVPKQILDEDETIEEFKIDETRSGRKRKPTEKAREHEITAKRQKVKPVKTPMKKSENPSSPGPQDTDIEEAETPRKTQRDSKLVKPVPVAKKIVRKVPKMQSSGKSSRKSPEGAVKRKKSVNEIDRLLQDEGVVNLLYDVEQPGKRRLVPVTKSQAKVMDIQKVQRELKIRTKLVKNAVLRLRTSAAPGPKAPRAKRISAGSVPMEEEPLITPSKTPPGEFLFPAKIRNAADASIIVRRHSSSSFSSASGSPRVSVDDRSSLEERGHGKRRDQEKRKESKKKKSVEKVENEVPQKIVKKSSPGKSKPIDRKKMPKPKDEEIDDEKNVRTNGTAGKIPKVKKTQRSKVTFAKHDLEEKSEDDLLEGLNETQDEEDELSACLAEAVTALASESSNRGKNSVLNRKGKTKDQRKEGKTVFSNKEINVQRHGNLVQLILTPSTTSKIRNGITLPMMQEFKEVLSILKKDDDCRIVLLTSTGSSFCEGLDLESLLEGDKDLRRANAQLLADGVKDFIKSLATFNKPIVAGVQGSAVGLGVTMLPLFDLVIASDKASFSTPYGKLGQIAEGAAVFTLSHVLGTAVTSELLLGGRTLTANEALRAGLVTRVLWPDRFHVELLPSLRAMSEQSSQSMEATKALLRHSLRSKLSAALESESYLLVQHWCSTECQNAIRAYMDEKVQ
ncbi:titin [Fopius arisanus]|uniref:Titin n=1 Tax=Fopius arisanus TaxID=64838 RepID=A0A9R1U2I1_9HYME|nr:PREDICTED: titin [Fopius arisanus]